jgi:hypothetical protein
MPYYRLPQTLRDNPDLRSVSRLTLFQSFRCVRLVLWDESRRRLVSFRDVRTQRLGSSHCAAVGASSTYICEEPAYVLFNALRRIALHDTQFAMSGRNHPPHSPPPIDH